MAEKQGLLSRTAARLVLALTFVLAGLAFGPAAAALAQPPQLTIDFPEGTPTNNPTPELHGTTDDPNPFDEVSVVIERVGGGGGVTLFLSPAGEEWSISPAANLPDGEYTAHATQTNALNEVGQSGSVGFRIDTSPPTVVLNQPTSPSNNTKPTFSGTATDTRPVVVHIKKEGTEVSSAEAIGTGTTWTSAAASPQLSEGVYTAIATQASSLVGNEAGTSSPVTFTIHTAPPVVKLDQPLAHSSVAKPTFTGTASDTTVVTVEVYLGTKVAGSPVATATALPAAEAWTSGPAIPELLPGKHIYTAVASQPSSLGNPPGTSPPVTFAVDTQAPSVTLNTPASPSNDATPSFTGTASETTQILVKINRGSEISNEVVATATASGTGGGWTTGPASATLPDGEYVAVASQPSAFGHDPGEAGPARFVVDTVPPQVNLSRPSAGSSSSGSTQLVEGTAGTAARDRAQVTVQLFTGSQIAAGQSPTQSVQVPANSGHWAATLAGLSPGSYVVRAEQADDAGNVGVSAATSFSVLASQAAAQAGPSASFTWSPSAPHVGDRVSLLSTSTDPASPITAFAWDLSGTGVFAGGGAVSGTSFGTPGQHVVRLRVTDAAGVSAVAAETIDVAASSLRLMHPFPIVRIAARGAGAGIRLKLLSVRAPAGARIAVGCSGKGCPVKSQSRIAAAGKPGAAPLEFRRFQRFLRPGVVLQIRISKPGEIGKYTRFVVRRGRLPARSDACIGSAAGKPIPCPSS